MCRKKYLRLKAATLVLQRYHRGYMARKFTQDLRRNNAVSNFSINARIYFYMFNDLIGSAYSISSSNVAMLSPLSRHFS